MIAFLNPFKGHYGFCSFGSMPMFHPFLLFLKLNLEVPHSCGQYLMEARYDSSIPTFVRWFYTFAEHKRTDLQLTPFTLGKFGSECYRLFSTGSKFLDTAVMWASFLASIDLLMFNRSGIGLKGLYPNYVCQPIWLNPSHSNSSFNAAWHTRHKWLIQA